MGFHLSALKEEICSLRRQLRQVSLGHRARSSVSGHTLCRPERLPSGACLSGSILSKTHFAPRPGHTLMCAHIGHAGQQDPGRQYLDHLVITLFS